MKTRTIFFDNGRLWVNVRICENLEKLHLCLRRSKVIAKNWDKDTIAYTHCFSEGHCLANIYLLANATIDDIAHEATHAALGILARSGAKTIRLTTGPAPQIEEDLARIVGHLSQHIKNTL